eukprot:NODE_1011_length_2226_cov_0.251058.p1 type:complete len:295 gc:universal NODE_1011_length_2226_cov_0.251058:1812-928(-)
MRYCRAVETSNVVFVLLPGNPGKAELYLDFMYNLYDNYNQKVDIYAINYLGHHEPSSLVFGLEQQIEYCRQQILNIKKDNPSAELYLFGHSLGAFIALRLECLADKVVLLFPSIDDFKSTYNAKLMWLAFTTLGVYMAAFFVWLLSFLPLAIKYNAIHFVEPRLSHDQVVIIARNWDHRIVYNTLGLVHEEISIIEPLDLDKLERLSRQDSAWGNKPQKLIDKCYFLFSPFDGWCSINTFRKIASRWPEKLITRKNICKMDNGGIFITDADIEHAFILAQNMKVAALISKIVPI